MNDTLEGDELGAGIPDALARQRILSRVPTDEFVSAYTLAGGFPMKRILRLLAELVESGEVAEKRLQVGSIDQFHVRRTL